MERLYSDPRWFGVRRDLGKAVFYHLFWGPAVGATRYITIGRHPRLVLQQSSKRGGIPNNPRPILVVGRTKSLWGISSLLTSDLTLYLFIWISCFTIWCYNCDCVLDWEKGVRCVCVFTGHSKLTVYHAWWRRGTHSWRRRTWNLWRLLAILEY